MKVDLESLVTKSYRIEPMNSQKCIGQNVYAEADKMFKK